MYSFFLLSIDPVLIVFVIIPLVVVLFLGKLKNRISHEYDMNRREEERQREYTRRTFYLSDYAKEMRLTNIHRVMLQRFDTSVKNFLLLLSYSLFCLAQWR